MTNKIISFISFTFFLLIIIATTSAVGNCTNERFDCSDHGLCYSDKSGCHCDVGYITFPTENVYPECNYAQKSQLTGFLLSLFIGPFTGAGFFYVGQVGLGVGQLIVLLVPTFLLCCFSKVEWIVFILKIIMQLGVNAFWIASIVLFASNKITDGNNAPLEKW